MFIDPKARQIKKTYSTYPDPAQRHEWNCISRYLPAYQSHQIDQTSTEELIPTRGANPFDTVPLAFCVSRMATLGWDWQSGDKRRGHFPKGHLQGDAKLREVRVFRSGGVPGR